MNYNKKLFIGLSLCALIVTAFGQVLPPVPKLAQSSACDKDLWIRIYTPARLTVNSPCVQVIGTIVDATAGVRKDGVRHEPDGDCHGWLRVDKGFEFLLNAGNKSHEGGNLVFEVVHMFPAAQADSLASAKGYVNKVVVPPVGSHVKIVGSWVMDDNHARWNEIHPVTTIEVVK